MSKVKEDNDKTTNTHNSETEDTPIDESDDTGKDTSTENALALYRKIREDNVEELTEKVIADNEKKWKIIEDRETITKDVPHKPVEVISEKGLVILVHQH